MAAGVVDCKAGRGSVQLGRYPSSHPFAQLQGSDNIIAFTTQRYFSQPLIIRCSAVRAWQHYQAAVASVSALLCRPAPSQPV